MTDAETQPQIRRFPRLALEPAYTAVTVQFIHRDEMKLRTIEGHAYDISVNGARIEVDEPLAVDERVAVCFRLPGASVSITASARVIWQHDEADDPGPRRAALEFTRFLSEDDHQRLVRYLDAELPRLAA